MEKNRLLQVVYELRQEPERKTISRAYEESLVDCPEITVISGLRRSGKSTLLNQLKANRPERDYYINFDDDRLIGFGAEDFSLLDEVFLSEFGPQNTYYLDEIQVIPGWERYVSRLYRQGKKVFLTGSNASLLSKELGTFLTGRHVTLDLFPFSFKEYLTANGIAEDRSDHFTLAGKVKMNESLQRYSRIGGIPQYMLSGNSQFISSLYNDIIYKDVAVRHNIDNDLALREMIFYLASNATHRFTYSSVARAIGVKSSDTVKDYIGYVSDTYLISAVNKFDYSAGVQTMSPKKCYFIDNAFIDRIGFNPTSNEGVFLENLVYVELRRRYEHIFYYAGDKECDFVIRQGATVTCAIQVTVSMENPATAEREKKGLVEALTAFRLKEGLLLVRDGSEELLEEAGLQIRVRPVWQWLIDD